MSFSTESRIKKEIKNIDYKNTSDFFKNRAKKYQEDNPYNVVLYQDNNPQLVKQRNRKEVEKIIPLLELDKKSRVLDIACGVGRWSDAIKEEINEYCGVDFSEELIELARKRNENKQNRFFLSGKANEIETVLTMNGKDSFNRVLMIGILMYLNDKDLFVTLEQVKRICTEKTIICIREPIAKEERLTLKDYYSEELKDNYNAIYRTKEEMMRFLKKAFLNNGFVIKKEGFVFEDDNLNNRKETIQYYFVIEN